VLVVTLSLFYYTVFQTTTQSFAHDKFEPFAVESRCMHQSARQRSFSASHHKTCV